MGAVRIGARAHDFGRMTASNLAKAITQKGFASVQLAPQKAIEGVNVFADATPAILEGIRADFEKHQLAIDILGCYVEPSLLDKEARLAQVATFHQGILNAKILGTSIIGTETTHLAPDTPAGERAKVFELLLDSVLRMVEVAEREGITIAIEPVADHTLNTPELTRELLDKVDSQRLKVIFDPFNLTLPSRVGEQKAIYQGVFDLLSDDIAIIHLKDMVVKDGVKTWANIGKGQIDYDTIFPHLNKRWGHIPILREEVKPEFADVDIENIIKYKKL